MVKFNSQEIIKLFNKDVLIFGMGNTLKGDDGFGSILASRLKDKLNCECLDAGTSPENYLGKIVKLNPEVILFVDAADLGKPAGAIELLNKEELLENGLTTHDISIKMLMDYLGKSCKSKIYMLAVQPKHLDFGKDLSRELTAALAEIEELLIKYLGKN